MRVPRRSRAMRALRVVGATMVVLLLAAVMSTIGLYFLLRGDSLGDSSLNRSIVANIERLLGPQFSIDLGGTAVAFDPNGLLSVAGNEVRVMRATDRQPVSTLKRVVVGVRPLSLLARDPQVDAIIIEDTVLDFAILPLMPSAGPIVDLKEMLARIGRDFARLGDQFANERFRLVRLKDVTLRGVTLGRRDPTDVHVSELRLRFRNKSQLTLDAKIETGTSSIELEARYRLAGADGASVEFTAGGINLREWLGDPYADEGPVGWDGIASIEGTMAFAPDGSPLEPKLTVNLTPGDLRVGHISTTRVRDAHFNLRILPDRNQIELDQSNWIAGEFRARLIGGLRPVDEKLGYSGPIEFELIANPAAGSPTVAGEESMPIALRLGGRIDVGRKLIDMSTITVFSGEDRAEGSASIVFGGPTPAIAAAGQSQGMPVAVVKQIWPFWLAAPARDWAFRNIHGGRLTNIALEAAIPAGIIGRIRFGARMAPEHFRMAADFGDVRFNSFGELPQISDATGKVELLGMGFRADLIKGEVIQPDVAPVALHASSFAIADYAQRPAQAEVHVSAEGDAGAVALISAAKPLDVPRRINMTAGQLSGPANADIVARFPLKRGLTPPEVEWNALIETRGGASSKPIEGRRIANANLMIEATPTRARVNGVAEIDGVRTSMQMSEPVGTGEPAERVFNAVLDEAARKKMGLKLAPIIAGTMKVRFEQQGKQGERHEVDLTDAELSLPWVGWTKGKGIAAKASFRMKADGQKTRLDDFYIEGPGFSAAGSIVFDKQGLLSADFANISLNQGDSLSIGIKRKAKLYEIVADGARYDARGLINKLIHQGGFGDAQGTMNVVMNANIGQVRGFNDELVRNVSLSYGTRDGWFDQLSLRGSQSNTEYVGVVASTVKGLTTFNINATDAGSALRMVDVYRRMRGGAMEAKLVRQGAGPFRGDVRVKSFIIEDEPRLARLVSEPVIDDIDRSVDAVQVRRELAKVDTNRVRFIEAKARIEKSDKAFRVEDGVLTGVKVGFTFDGLLYDEKDRMDLTGTFMPGMSLSRAIGMIPLVGELLGNGKDSALLGITFRLSGQRKNPVIEINPMSMVTPGIFRKVFEFRSDSGSD